MRISTASKADSGSVRTSPALYQGESSPVSSSGVTRAVTLP